MFTFMTKSTDFCKTYLHLNHQSHTSWHPIKYQNMMSRCHWNFFSMHFRETYFTIFGNLNFRRYFGNLNFSVIYFMLTNFDIKLLQLCGRGNAAQYLKLIPFPLAYCSYLILPWGPKFTIVRFSAENGVWDTPVWN